MDKRFDVIIVGSGAGGGTLARCLAPSGKNILILERGDWLKREADNWDAAAVFEYSRDKGERRGLLPHREGADQHAPQ